MLGQIIQRDHLMANDNSITIIHRGHVMTNDNSIKQYMSLLWMYIAVQAIPAVNSSLYLWIRSIKHKHA